MKTPRAPRIKIEVTEEILRDSISRDSSHCMIAKGVEAAAPNARHISVDIQTIRYTDPERGLRYTYLTPRVGQVAIIKFDQGMEMEPFTLQLRNGQVTNAGRKKPPRPSSEAQKARSYKGLAAAKEQLGTARLAPRDSSEKPRGAEIPDRIGGRTPPVTSVGRRRAYGIAAIER